MCLGFRVWCLRFRFLCLRFRVLCLGFRVLCLGFRVEALALVVVFVPKASSLASYGSMTSMHNNKFTYTPCIVVAEPRKQPSTQVTRKPT